jgi:beta-lactamase regulating signal transducer with metallopeptidase domain
LDKKQDKVYIIHQILSYGDLKNLRKLFRVYSRREIREIFIRYPKKIYQPAVFYFIKNFILGLKNKRLKEKNYVKTLF